MKSKLSLPKAVDSVLAWLPGGLLSKTGLKSSSPEREMLAKSSSAEPSLASSRPSKSLSRSSKPPLAWGGLDGAACCDEGAVPVAAAPKMSSTDDFWALPSVIVAGDEGCSTLVSVSYRFGFQSQICQVLPGCVGFLGRVGLLGGWRGSASRSCVCRFGRLSGCGLSRR